MKGYPKKVESNDLTHNNEIAKKLWEISEDWTGVKFSLIKTTCGTCGRDMAHIPDNNIFAIKLSRLH